MIKMALGLLVFAACSGAGVFAVRVPLDTPLNMAPFVMTHDTATGYLGEMYGLYEMAPTPEEILIGWTKTQVGTVTDQINCGARSFDMRPYLTEDNRLIAHHGGVLVDYPFKDMMQEMVVWANDNPDEFLLPSIAHCSGDTDELKEQCNVAARDVLNELGIPLVFEDECPQAIKGLTLGQAMNKGKLEGGGHVLALWNTCWASNYDSTRNCRGYEYETAGVSRKYNCWINSTINPDYAVNRIMEYLDETHKAGPPEDGRVWQMQALWQSVQQSISLGTTTGSSLLIDIKYSRLNRFMFENLTEGRWGTQQGVDGVNIFEVDFICDQGSNIFMSIDPAFDGNWTDFPDDVIVNSTGISHSILAGDTVIFYQTPDDYKPLEFKDNDNIRRRHRNTRWGNTNDIVEFFNGDEDKQNEYLVGIMGGSILIWCIFIVWAILLVWAKWSNKLKWLSGTPPPKPVVKSVQGPTDESAAPPEEADGDGVVVTDNYAAVRKYRLRIRRIRITVLCCGVIILVLSGCLIGLGFVDLANALDTTGESLDKVQVLVGTAQEVAHDYLVQANQTREAMTDFINALVNNCNLTGEAITNETGVNVTELAGGNLTDDLIEFNTTLSNWTDLYDAIDSMNSSLYSLNYDIQSIEDTADEMATNILFPIAVTFICLVDVAVIIFMVGVILAWRKQQPRLFYDCTSKAAVPIFLLLLLCAYVVSTLALIAATLAADFCIDTPDNQFLRIINATAPFDEFIQYFVRQCNPKIKPEMLEDLFKVVEFVLIQIHETITALAEADPSELPCTNGDTVVAMAQRVQEEYETYVDLLYRLGVALACDKINPIYALLAYGTGCVNGFNSLSQIFAYLLVIALCSMTIITLRVAWYETDDEADEVELHPPVDDAAYAEQQEDENSEMSSSPYAEDDQPEEFSDPVNSADSADDMGDRYQSQYAPPDMQGDKNIASGVTLD